MNGASNAVLGAGRRWWSPSAALAVAIVVVVATLPGYGSVFVVGIATTAAIYVVLGLAVAVIYWSTGGIHFGIAALSMFAAYVVVIGTSHGWPLILAEAVSVLGTGVASVLLAPLLFRLRGIYFAIMTFAVASLVGEIAGDINITGNQQGLSFVPTTGPVPGVPTGTNGTYFEALMLVALCVGALWVYRRTATSRRGLALNNDEVLCRSLGVRRKNYQAAASFVGGLLAGLAGILFVFALGYVSPGEFDVSVSLGALAALIVGGQRFLPGPIVGSLVVVFLPALLNLGGFWDAVIYAGSLFAVVTLLPDGLMKLGEIRPDRFAVRRMSPAPAEAGGVGAVDSGGVVGGNAQASEPLAAMAASNVRHEATDGLPYVMRSHARGTATNSTAARLDRLRPDAREPSLDRQLRADGVTVRYGGVVAVRDVSFALDRGEVLGLIGANGSGKSTLVNALSGLAVRASGQVWMDGKEIGRDVTELALGGLRRTFQGVRTFPWLSVQEHLDVVCLGTEDAASSNGYELRERVLGVLRIPEISNRMPGDLPYGSQRLLGLALAAFSLPTYLLLDEPTSGLHEREAARVADVISLLSQWGTGILVIDHNMRFLTEIAPRSLALHAGALIAEGTTTEVLQSQEVRQVYVGD